MLDIFQILLLRNRLLVDDSEPVWDFLSEQKNLSESKIVDLVMDNAGFELFADLCLAGNKQKTDVNKFCNVRIVYSCEPASRTSGKRIMEKCDSLAG